MRELKIVMEELKQQHEWRLEDSECGSCEVAESWDKTKYRIVEEIKSKHPDYCSDCVKIIEAS